MNGTHVRTTTTVSRIKQTGPEFQLTVVSVECSFNVDPISGDPDDPLMQSRTGLNGTFKMFGREIESFGGIEPYILIVHDCNNFIDGTKRHKVSFDGKSRRRTWKNHVMRVMPYQGSHNYIHFQPVMFPLAGTFIGLDYVISEHHSYSHVSKHLKLGIRRPYSDNLTFITHGLIPANR